MTLIHNSVGLRWPGLRRSSVAFVSDLAIGMLQFDNKLILYYNIQNEKKYLEWSITSDLRLSRLFKPASYSTYYGAINVPVFPCPSHKPARVVTSSMLPSTTGSV